VAAPTPGALVAVTGDNANDSEKCGWSTDVERLVKATVCLVDGVISAQMR